MSGAQAVSVSERTATFKSPGLEQIVLAKQL